MSRFSESAIVTTGKKNTMDGNKNDNKKKNNAIKELILGFLDTPTGGGFLWLVAILAILFGYFIFGYLLTNHLDGFFTVFITVVIVGIIGSNLMMKK